MTDREIKEYIQLKCRGISYDDMMQIRNALIYQNIELDVSIQSWLANQQN